ncbi:YonK family protein [Shouchella clausii]|uniref:YonK family protein n=1 Tax=Shouchella clausii TaxID=79880 RepID=UPI001C731C67|nr:YonK family protein [Shouchella clausii]MBX0320177.1 YonK family protein [Shouchella clausii]
MAKYTNTTALNGYLDIESTGTMTVEEEIKGKVQVYDLSSVLERYQGRKVSITIKEDEPLQPMER